MMHWFSRVERQVETDARDADVTYSVLLGGRVGQTLSMRAARGARDGKPGWCALCALLSVLVQRRHCQVTLDGGPMGWTVYVRAAVCFAAATALAAWGVWALVSFMKGL